MLFFFHRKLRENINFFKPIFFLNSNVKNIFNVRFFLFTFAVLCISIFTGTFPVVGQIVIDTIETGDNPGGVDINSNSNKIYVTNTGGNSVTVIDGGTNEIINTVSVGNRPFGVAVNENTNVIYVANMDDDNVSVINGTTNLVTETIDVGDEPWEICVNSETNRIYVTNSKDNNISVIDGSINQVINTISTGNEPIGIAINEDINIIYVSNKADNTISLIDGEENQVIDTIQLSGIPFGIGVNSVTNLIYVAIADKDVIEVIDGLNNQVVFNIPIGDVPYGVGVNSITNHVYVTNHRNDTISIVDGSVAPEFGLDPVVNAVVVGQSPFGISVNPDTNRIYVVNEGSNAVTVILGEEIPAPVPQPTCFDVARFNADTKSGTLPLIIQFNDESGEFPDKELTWEFGDGTESNKKNPAHTYNKAGIYTVSLSVVPCSSGFGFSGLIKNIDPDVAINSCCSSFKIKSNFINVFSEERTETLIPIIISPPSVNFTAIPTTGGAPLKVQFTDTSQGDSDSWFWEFGDGNTSRIKNPQHEYVNDGIFTVSLSIKGPGGSDSLIKDGFVTVGGSPTPTPTTVTILPLLSVSPDSAKSSLRLKEATVIVNDQTGELFSGILVTATAIGFGTVVTPASQITDNDGAAKFQFRFGFITDDGKIIFNANEISGSITQE